MAIEFQKDGRIAWLTISRPQALNALNRDVLEALDARIAELEQATDIGCVVVTGAGEKAFVAGADIKEMQDLNPQQARAMAGNGHRIFQRMTDLPFPSFAAVNGFALGGGLELALACDFIIASDKAKIGLPEVGLGLIPGYGGTQRLARLAGWGVARRMVYSGAMVSAQQAYDWGVITQVCPAEQLRSVASEIASEIAGKSPNALRLAKRTMAKGLDAGLTEGLKNEIDAFEKAFENEEHNEGIQAFLEKRAPKFVN